MARTMTVRQWPVQQIELALLYLEDGAGYSAARLLREAADRIEADAQKRTAELDALMGSRKPAA